MDRTVVFGQQLHLHNSSSHSACSHCHHSHIHGSTNHGRHHQPKGVQVKKVKRIPFGLIHCWHYDNCQLVSRPTVVCGGHCACFDSYKLVESYVGEHGTRWTTHLHGCSVKSNNIANRRFLILIANCICLENNASRPLWCRSSSAWACFSLKYYLTYPCVFCTVFSCLWAWLPWRACK